MGRLDPVDLNVLAGHLRDETWLDMRVLEAGVMERVVIEGLTVRLESEELDVRQDWLEEGEVVTENYIVECENIIRVLPTTFELEDVTPFKLEEKAALSSLDGWDAAWHAAILSVAHTLQVPGDHLVAFCTASGGGQDYLLHARYLVMLVMYEISDLSDLEITKRAGYHSVQPMVTARQRWQQDKYKKVIVAVARAKQLYGMTVFPRNKSVLK